MSYTVIGDCDNMRLPRQHNFYFVSDSDDNSVQVINGVERAERINKGFIACSNA